MRLLDSNSFRRSRSNGKRGQAGGQVPVQRWLLLFALMWFSGPFASAQTGLICEGGIPCPTKYGTREGPPPEAPQEVSPETQLEAQPETQYGTQSQAPTEAPPETATEMQPQEMQPEMQPQAGMCPQVACPRPELPGQFLTGHAALPSYFFPNPFALPSATFGMAFAEGTLPVSVLNLQRSVRVGAYGPKVDLQVKLLKRLVFLAGVSGNVIFGIGGQSLASYGASASYVPRIGLLWNPILSKHSVLGIGVDWERPYRIQASPIEATSRVVSSVLARSEGSLVDEEKVTRVKPNLQFAHGLTRMIGFNAYGSVSWNSENLNEVNTNSTQYTLGASVEFDLKPDWNIPIGFKVSYRYVDFLKGTGAGVQTASVGIFERFSDRYNIGFEFAQIKQGDEDATAGALVSRYFY